MRSSCIPNEPALIKCSSEGTGDKHCRELAAAPAVPLPRAAAPLMALPEHHRAPCAGQRSTDASSAVPGREARGSCSPVQQYSPKPLPPAHRDSSEAGETWIGDAGGRGCFLVISFICQKESWRYQTSGLCPKLRGICEPQVQQPRVGSSPFRDARPLLTCPEFPPEEQEPIPAPLRAATSKGRDELEERIKQRAGTRARQGGTPEGLSC